MLGPLNMWFQPKGSAEKKHPKADADGWELILAMSTSNIVPHQPHFFLKFLHIEYQTWLELFQIHSYTFSFSSYFCPICGMAV